MIIHHASLQRFSVSFECFSFERFSFECFSFERKALNAEGFERAECFELMKRINGGEYETDARTPKTPAIVKLIELNM